MVCTILALQVCCKLGNCTTFVVATNADVLPVPFRFMHTPSP